MKDSDYDEQWLDELLEQPAVLADHGFINSLTARIRREEKSRKLVFSAAAVVWLIILLALFPIQFLTEISQRSLTISATLQARVQSLAELDPTALLSQSGSLTLLVVFLLGVYALISLQTRRF